MTRRLLLALPLLLTACRGVPALPPATPTPAPPTPTPRLTPHATGVAARITAVDVNANVLRWGRAFQAGSSVAAALRLEITEVTPDVASFLMVADGRRVRLLLED